MWDHLCMAEPLSVIGKRSWWRVLYYRMQGMRVSRYIYEDCGHG